MAKPQYDHLWALAHAERAALADDLAGLSVEQWQQATLCAKWNVEDVVAHLTAAASHDAGKVVAQHARRALSSRRAQPSTVGRTPGR